MLKKIGFWLIILLCIGVFLPGIMIKQWGKYAIKPASLINELQGFDGQTAISLLLVEEGETKNISLEEYLMGVVWAEMPAYFSKEALKAQAVAARTYTLYQKNRPSTHEQTVCDDSRHCCAYLSSEEMKELWGEEEYLKNFEKIKEAVRATDGQILTYEEEPIAAVFHSTSAEKTESAQNIWGNPIPYLQSVKSPNLQESPRTSSQLIVPSEEFYQTIYEKNPSFVVQGEPSSWLGESTTSQAGTMLNCPIGNLSFHGNELRELFSLRSPNFSLSYQDSNFIFQVAGYGHGVGLSQYGAQKLAEEGKTYKEILNWYYTDVELITLFPNESSSENN